MQREDALGILAKTGTQTPHGDIARLCEFLQINVSRFYDIAESFRDHDVWSRRNNQWIIDDFLVPEWNWDENRAQRTAA